MKRLQPLLSLVRITGALLLATTSLAGAEIPPEPMGWARTLPTAYLSHWIVVQDASLFHPSDGKIILLDADLDARHEHYMGTFNGSYVAQLAKAATRTERYVAETFHSRGHRGVGTDVLTIYEKRTLAPVVEVVWSPKRMLALPQGFAALLIDTEKFVSIFNLTPAT